MIRKCIDNLSPSIYTPIFNLIKRNCINISLILLFIYLNCNHHCHFPSRYRTTQNPSHIIKQCNFETNKTKLNSHVKTWHTEFGMEGYRVNSEQFYTKIWIFSLKINLWQFNFFKLKVIPVSNTKNCYFTLKMMSLQRKK